MNSLELSRCRRVFTGLHIFLVSRHAQSSSPSLFQCQFSSDGSGRVYTPNIPDFYFNATNAASFLTDAARANLTASNKGFTRVFTIPSESPQRNCSGNVVSIQYCYQASDSDLGTRRIAFTFLTVELDGLRATVTGSFGIQTNPHSSICTNPPGNIQQVCCDTVSLGPNNQFQIPASSFSFNVLTNGNLRPLTFADSAVDFRVVHYRSSFGVAILPGNVFVLSETQLQNESSIVLMRLFIGKASRVHSGHYQ